METVNDLFEQFGGTGAVAKALNVGHSTASEMRRRSSIPVKYWPALIDHAKSIGKDDFDNNLLVKLHLPASTEASAA